MKLPLYSGCLTVMLPGFAWAQCEVLKLDGPASLSSTPEFGFSLSLHGSRMVVGMPDAGPALEGSAEVFERLDGVGWVSAGKLFASDGEPYDEFGYSVAVEGDRLVVGAIAHGALGAKGAAYVFERQTEGTWLETAKLLPPDEAWGFGWSIDIVGDRIAVGAKGASALSDGKGRVVIFEHDGTAWVKRTTIKPTISVGGDGFGASLDLEQDRLVVGAPYLWVGSGNSEGLAFVYEPQAAVGAPWSQKAVLSPPELTSVDMFGNDVALDGDRIVVGAPQFDEPTFIGGAAFVYDLQGTVWTKTSTLAPADLPPITYFGWGVDIEGSRIVVGARSDSGAALGGGAAYLFEEGAQGWSEVQKFYGSGTGVSDTFGYRVDLEGSEILVGAPHAASGPPDPGSAHLFLLDSPGPSLLADAPSVSLSLGGAQGLQLGACPEHAGDLYALAGSATGTRPGFAFAGFDVPLNLDAYFLHTLAQPGFPLTQPIGVFDAFGRAHASFALPAGFEPTLAGLTLHHAYAVLDPTTLALEAVSPAVAVALVP
jgi:hypothetical protein